MKAKRTRRRPQGPVVVQPFSENAKTGRVTVTYAPQKTCPDTCELKGHGCYAEAGPIGIITRRLEAASTGMTPLQVAQAEADAIDATPAYTDIRLHGVGDCSTDEAAKVVAGAAERYEERGRAYKATAWNYTHAWRDVSRESWGGVSVLASCHSVSGAEEAMERGYAASVIVAEFGDGNRAWEELGDGEEPVTLIPCPWQTKRVTCRECRLCMSDWKLLESRRVIAFKAHGSGRKSVLKSLPVMGG